MTETSRERYNERNPGIGPRIAATALLLALGAAPLLRSQAQPAPEPTAEQKYKNIKVLTGMPASQMLPVMHLMRASLGVHCDFCHVTEYDRFDLDTKKAKETARQMIRMVLEINRENFEGRTEVTCNTCHRGQERPVRTPPIGQGLFADTTHGEAEAPAEKQPDAAAVFDRYVAALGGRPALEAVTSRVARGTVLRPAQLDAGTPKARVINRGQEDPLEIVQPAPGKVTMTVGPPDRPIVQSYDGQSGTIKTPEGERAMTPREMSRIATFADLRSALALRDQAAKARVVGRDTIDGKAVLLVRAAAADGNPALLAFDAGTGLLRRQTVSRPTVLGPDPEQTDFDDYRSVGHVKVPFLVKTSYIDDNHLGTTRKLTAVRDNDTAPHRDTP
jgi:hypothetical protein